MSGFTNMITGATGMITGGGQGARGSGGILSSVVAASKKKKPDLTPPAKTDDQVQEGVSDTLADIRRRRGRRATIKTSGLGITTAAPTARTMLLGG